MAGSLDEVLRIPPPSRRGSASSELRSHTKTSGIPGPEAAVSQKGEGRRGDVSNRTHRVLCGWGIRLRVGPQGKQVQLSEPSGLCV